MQANFDPETKASNTAIRIQRSALRVSLQLTLILAVAAALDAAKRLRSAPAGTGR